MAATPVAPTRGALRPLGLAEARIVGGFWATRQQTNGEATLDHGRTWMDKLGWTGNFIAAAASPDVHNGPMDRRGREFSDSEVYKLIEAMAWEIGRTGDPARDREGVGPRSGVGLEAAVRELVGLIGGAQRPDGYLNTAFGGPGQLPRYSDLAHGHELYCTGHLLQAAVARARTHGHDELLELARRAADHVCDTFGPNGLPGICGHPEIEPGLVELARVTGEQRYLDQAALFIARRGHGTLPEHEFGPAYFQDDVPVRQAEVLRGHAVRALYLSCGAVDVAVETGDDELLDAVARQFARTVARRTYLTGGMGSRHADEAFGEDFVLPADRAYAETCAAVAAVMLAWRLLLATGDPGYADYIERALYNMVATAIADDGRSFFYANTLHQRVLTALPPTDKHQLNAGGGLRAPWREVSCCLGNIARLLASLATYLATMDGDGIQLHQYADADISTRLADGRAVGLQVRTGYPDSGVVTIRVTETGGGPWTLGLRIPPWAGEASVSGVLQRPVEPGIAVLRHDFAAGDVVRLNLRISPRWTFPDPRIDAVRGCVAVERGPLVLCAESTDQDGHGLDDLRVDVTGQPGDVPGGATVPGRTGRPEDVPWPYTQTARLVPEEPAPVRLVPYHRWARRGPSTMRVWLPTS